MEKYKDSSGNSGVLEYEIHPRSIGILFRGEEFIYIYDYESPGKEAVEKMKALAKEGRGLSTYISQHVRANYARKLIYKYNQKLRDF